MNTLRIVIDGENFSTLEEFYDEMDKIFTKQIGWETGHNLDAFNDILSGGFGVYEYEESIILIWKNYAKSYKLLGQKTIDIITEIINQHNYHIEFIKTD